MMSTNKTSPIINKETIKISIFFSNSIIKKLYPHCTWKSWDSTYKSSPEKWHYDIFYDNGESFSEKGFRFIEEMIHSVNN